MNWDIGPITGAAVTGPISQFNDLFDLELASHSSIEAQCAAVADDIAYNAHDLDDGLRAGLFSLGDLDAVPIAGETLVAVRQKYPDLDAGRQRHEIIRKQITAMVEDVILNARRNLGAINPRSVNDVRHCGETIVDFSPSMSVMEKEIKSFLFERMYRAPSVMAMREDAKQIMRDIFDAYVNDISSRPSSLNEWIAEKPEKSVRRIIADFIASMTDDYAIQQHRHLFDATPELR